VRDLRHGLRKRSVVALNQLPCFVQRHRPADIVGHSCSLINSSTVSGKFIFWGARSWSSGRRKPDLIWGFGYAGTQTAKSRKTSRQGRPRTTISHWLELLHARLRPNCRRTENVAGWLLLSSCRTSSNPSVRL
jgi:hypothetical protein